MMKKPWFYLSLLFIGILAAGCELSTPPECLPSFTQCELNILNGAVYSVCNEGQWQALKSCYDCRNGECVGGYNQSTKCENEGETQCYDSGSGSFQLTCSNKQWIPSICSSNGCDGDHCKESNECQDDGQSVCTWIDSLRVAIVFICQNNKMQSRYCPIGSVCNPDGTGCNLDNSELPCAEVSGDFCTEDEIISTWSKAICMDGNCEVTECVDGYTMNAGTCKPSTLCCGSACENCMAKDMICSSSDINIGQCIPKCSADQIECDGACIDPKSSNQYCNADSQCEHYETCGEDRICSNGACICSPKEECENACFDLSTTLNHCGNCETDCTTRDGWKNGTCENGLCNATECESGYTIKTETINLTEVPYCANISTTDACGENETNCAEITGWKSGTCTNGNCVPTECIEGYHPYDSICEHHDDNNCGTHGNACIGSSVPHALATECDTQAKKCIATHCDSGYHVFEGQCEKDDNTNCGEHGKACTTNDITGSTQVSCNTGICLATNCNSAYLLDNGTCKDKNCEEGVIKCFTENNIGKRYKCINNNWDFQNNCTDNHSCKDNNTCGECTDSEKTCENSSSAIGTVKTCKNGQWETTETCSFSCNLARDDCGTCKNGEKSCANTGIIGYQNECNNGTWGTPAPCTDNHTCKSSTACGVCQNNTKQCSGKTIQTCSNGNWTNSTTCKDPTNGTATCKKGECSYSCNSNYTYNGKKCCADVDNGSITVNNSNTCSFECNSGFCKDTASGKCLNKQTDMNNCGTCGVPCNPSKVPGSTTVTCNNGTCQATTCDNDHVLSNGRCIDKKCSENDIKCENDTNLVGKIYKCINNDWVLQTSPSCTGSCKSDGKTCGTCINNKTSCSNNDSGIGQQRRCNNGVWGNPTACNNVSCNGSACGSCYNGKKRCKSNTQTELCSGGKWVNDTTCTPPSNATATCTDGNCGYNCNDGLVNNGVMCCPNINHGKLVENSKTCEFTCDTNYFKCNGECLSVKNYDKNNCGACNYRCDDHISNAQETTCAAGVCKATKCMSGYKLNGGQCIERDCIEGEVQCRNSGTTGFIYVCTADDVWAQTEQCRDNHSCNADGKECGECINNAVSCTNDTNIIGNLQTCKNGQWTDKKTCESVSCNSDNTNCGSCINNQKRCTNNASLIGQIQKCTLGSWEADSDCGKYSCNNNSCGRCKNGTTYCNNNLQNEGMIYTCNNGQWPSNPTNVCNNLSCNAAGTSCGECMEGKTECINGTSGQTARYRTCTMGRWSGYTNCPNIVSCNGSSCGECQNGTSQCHSRSEIQYCINGLYNEPTTCTFTHGSGGCNNGTGTCTYSSCDSNYSLYHNHCIPQVYNCENYGTGYCLNRRCSAPCYPRNNYVSCGTKLNYVMCISAKECTNTQYLHEGDCIDVIQSIR